MIINIPPRYWIYITVLSGLLSVVLLGVVVAILLEEQQDTDEDVSVTEVARTAPDILVESTPSQTTVGSPTPIRIRVDDSLGLERVVVELGPRVVWQPDILPGQQVVRTTFPWIPDRPGTATLRIRAVAVDGLESEKIIPVVVAAAPEGGDEDREFTIVVQAGDDPFELAQGYGVCPDELIAANANLAAVAPGDEIIIPIQAGGGQPPPGGRPGPGGGPGGCELVDFRFQHPQIGIVAPEYANVFPINPRFGISRGYGCAVFFSGVPGTECPEDKPWFHTGIDVGAPPGTPLFTISSGRVSYAGPDETSDADCSEMRGSEEPHNGYGNHVRIQSGRYLFLYAHLSEIVAAPGDVYEDKGELLGFVGSTGCSTAPHLHFEVRRDNVTMDPLEYFESLEETASDDNDSS
ncbi:MAG: M23 family metallopeptidase [Chloroflexi bacterium]|nr:M23 family metallopeptidase [Chloroflexota bacterium]